MTCTLIQFKTDDKGDPYLIKYSCDDIRDLQEDLKKIFREKNGTDKIIQSGMKDKQYDDYCMELDNFLNKCDCKDIQLICNKCNREDHEGYFCRCESRNIKLAKQLRDNGKSPWIKFELKEKRYGKINE